MDAAGHHVLGHRRAGIAMHRDTGQLVHAGGVITRVAMDIDVYRRVDTDRNAVGAIGVMHCHRDRSGRQFPVQVVVERAQRLHREVERHARHR